MSIAYQARALGVAGHTFKKSVFRAETHVAITYRPRDVGSAVTLDSAYFGEIGTRRDGGAGMQEIVPDATLAVLVSELAAPAVGALVVQGTDRYKVESFRVAPGGVEWTIELTRAT